MPNNLARARFDMDRISQRETAKKAGIHSDRYWRIENDYAIPTADERAALARVLNASESVLFGTESDTPVAHV